MRLHRGRDKALGWSQKGLPEQDTVLANLIFLAAKASIASMWKRLLGQGVTPKLGAWQSYRQRPADFSLTGAVGHSLYKFPLEEFKTCAQ